MVKKRDTRFELLRIIAMFMIVLNHSVFHGVFSVNPVRLLNYPINTAVLSLFQLGEVGVFLFVLITGFFMINLQISIKKLVKLWLPIFFWSLVLYIIMSKVTGYSITLKNLITVIFPITFSQYWFMTCYFFMYLLIPILNLIVKVIKDSQRLYLYILLGFILLFSGLSFFSYNAGNHLISFCVVYCFGALIRLNNSKTKTFINKSKFIFLIYILAIELPLILFFLTKKMIFKSISCAFAINYSFLLVVLTAIALFLFVLKYKSFYNSLINKIATSVFGIYLISDNNYVREWLWNSIFKMNKMYSSTYVIGYVLLVSLIVFAVCSILALIHNFIFEKFENYIGNYAENNFQKIQNYFLNRLK